MTLDELKTSTRAALTIAVVAQLLDKDPRTIRRAVAAGELPSIRLSRSVLIPREPLLALLTNTKAPQVLVHPGAESKPR